MKKLKDYCTQEHIVLARHFSEDDLYRHHQWLLDQGYAEKTIQGAVTLAKQAFKWAWRQRILGDYRLAAARFRKAKADPQPCFTSDEADRLIASARGEEKAAFALMAYAGLRIGEVEQLRWEDIHRTERQPTMIQVRRGGSSGTRKDKEERFVPVHPKVAAHLNSLKKSGPIFKAIRERTLLQRLKELCAECGFENPQQYKLHTFRHHFASLCANNNVAYRKALTWLGHSSSQMLELYYHLHDEDRQRAIAALAGNEFPSIPRLDSTAEGNLRATGGQK